MSIRLGVSRALRRLARRFGVHRAALLLGLVELPAVRIVELLVKRVPRDPRLVAMGSPLDRFADNAAYLYVHLSERMPEQMAGEPPGLRPVWLSGSSEVVRRLRSLGYRAERRWSWGGIRTTLRAGTFVYSAYRADVNRWLSPGATAVCLWHGLPVKRVEAGVVSMSRGVDALLNRLARAGREPPPDYLLSSSEFVTARFTSYFGVPAQRCWEIGYPRTDHLLIGPSQPPPALVWHDDVWRRLRGAGCVVGLFPTWRDDRVDDALDERLVRQLARACAERGAVLAYKAHYNVVATSAPPECVVVPADADLHAYLGLCDVLVTDYSSISLDFLLMRRPVVYFMPDIERYAAQRGFAVDPLALPGFVTHAPEALLDALAALLESRCSWAPSAADIAFLREMWGGYDGRAAEAIAARLESLEPGRSAQPLSGAGASSAS